MNIHKVFAIVFFVDGQKQLYRTVYSSQDLAYEAANKFNLGGWHIIQLYLEIG